MRREFSMVLYRALRASDHISNKMGCIGRGMLSPLLFGMNPNPLYVDFWNDVHEIYDQMLEHKFKINYDVVVVSTGYFVIRKLYGMLKQYEGKSNLPVADMSYYKTRLINIVNNTIKSEMKAVKLA